MRNKNIYTCDSNRKLFLYNKLHRSKCMRSPLVHLTRFTMGKTVKRFHSLQTNYCWEKLHKQMCYDTYTNIMCK